MILVDKLAEKIFGVMKGFGHQVKMYTAEGTETVDPAAAKRFFSTDSGLMVTIDEQNNEVQLSQSNTQSLDENRQLQRNMKRLANEFLMNYTVRNYNKSIKPKDFSYKAKIERNNQMTNVAEGLSKMDGSKKTSHQTLENVRILVKHKTPVDEESRGARSRNIQSIFLEMGGEKFRFPHNHLGGARAMARHLAAGGQMHDIVGSYVTESVSHLLRLNEFLRYVKSNNLINEDTTDVVATVKENIEGIKTELKRLSGMKTYESISSRIEEQDMELQESEVDLSSLRDMFTVKRFDEKFDDVLPIVNRLVTEKEQKLRKIEEAASATVYVTDRVSVMDSVVEFSSQEAKMGNHLIDLAGRIVENEDLAAYVGKIGRKLCKESELTAFERDIISSVLENSQPQPAQEPKTPVHESVEWEEFFDKYTYTFI
jgi:hypothetical protein